MALEIFSKTCIFILCVVYRNEARVDSIRRVASFTLKKREKWFSNLKIVLLICRTHLDFFVSHYSIVPYIFQSKEKYLRNLYSIIIPYIFQSKEKSNNLKIVLLIENFSR